MADPTESPKSIEATMSGNPKTIAAVGAAAPSAMPLFYKNPHPLNPLRHGELSLKTEINCGFARHTNSVPLNAAEFMSAARHFPIVFMTAPTPGALAVLGVRKDENLFVDDRGAWKGESYIPAYIRRYPFIFLESEDGKTLSLCIDEAAGATSKSDVRPFFRDGEPTDATRGALEFCAAFQREHSETQAFVKILKESGLLMPCQANIALNGGEQLSLSGFEVVDMKKLDALPDEAFVALRKGGALTAIYAHLLSQMSWQVLVERSARPRPPRT